MLFFTLDMAFLLLGIGYLEADASGPKTSVIKAGGVFGLLAAFLAWYNALAGMLDDSNRYVYDFRARFVIHTEAEYSSSSAWNLADKSSLAASSSFRSPIFPGPSLVVRGARRAIVRLSKPAHSLYHGNRFYFMQQGESATRVL